MWDPVPEAEMMSAGGSTSVRRELLCVWPGRGRHGVCAGLGEGISGCWALGPGWRPFSCPCFRG